MSVSLGMSTTPAVALAQVAPLDAAEVSDSDSDSEAEMSPPPHETATSVASPICHSPVPPSLGAEFIMMVVRCDWSIGVRLFEFGLSIGKASRLGRTPASH